MEIYTTGAYVRSMKVDGQWRWIVTSFEGGDSYDDDSVFNPPEIADTQEELEVNLTPDDDEEEE